MVESVGTGYYDNREVLLQMKSSNETTEATETVKYSIKLGNVLSIIGIISICIQLIVYFARIEPNFKATVKEAEFKLNQSISDIKEELKQDVSDVKTNMAKLNAKTDDIDRRLSTVENSKSDSNPSIYIVAGEPIREVISKSYNSMMPLADDINISDDVTIGTYENGDDVKLENLKGVPFYTNYKTNDSDIWFYGSLNEKGNWHGSCVLNVYQGDNLITLIEAEYNNGKIIGNFKSILHYYDTNERTNSYVYGFHDRIQYDNYTTGKTWIYIDAEFPNTEFKSDVPIRYYDCTGEKLIKYYNGQISDKKYNDNTGDAFYIAYTVDHKVRLFYQGSFVDGNFADKREVEEWERNQENSAFWIVLANDESTYLYYIGSFLNGEPTDQRWYKDAERFWIRNPEEKLPKRNDIPKLEWKVISKNHGEQIPD